jgi:plasmid maintenance system killer protein
MELYFKTRKLEKACGEEREVRRRWGADRAPVVLRRITQLMAAETLADVSTLRPARLHQLEGDRAGQFAVDIGPIYRMIFEPWHDPVPKTKDKSIDKTQITKIRILSIEDYHGR